MMKKNNLVLFGGGLLIFVAIGLTGGWDEDSNTSTTANSPETAVESSGTLPNNIEHEEKENEKQYALALEEAVDFSVALETHSRKEIKDFVLEEGYSEEIANRINENLNVSWHSFAFYFALENYKGYPDEVIKEQLLLQQFTEEEADYALKNLNNINK